MHGNILNDTSHESRRYQTLAIAQWTLWVCEGGVWALSARPHPRGQTFGSKEARNWCHDFKMVSDGYFVGKFLCKKRNQTLGKTLEQC